MKNTKNKVTSIFIFLTILLSAICLFRVDFTGKVEAEDSEPFVYNLLLDGTYSIGVNSAYRQNFTELIIPSEYNGIIVTEISVNGFMLCNNLTKVYFPKTIRKIGNSAFAFCKNLNFVGLSQIVEIGQNAFSSCTNLKEIVVPQTVDTIGATAFRGDNSIIYIRKSEEDCESFDSAWQSSANLEIVYDYQDIVYSEINDEEGTLIGYSLDNAMITNPENMILALDLHNGKPILNIGYAAFMGAEFNTIRLQPIGHAMNVSSFAFTNSNIIQIECYNNVTFYDDLNKQTSSDSVFAYSPLLRKVILPKNMSEISSGMFAECINLEEITVYGEQYSLPNINKICADAFSNCKNISRLIIPNSVIDKDNINIDNAAFEHWEYPQTIYFEFEKPQNVDFKNILGLEREYENNDPLMPLIMWNKEQYRVDFFDKNRNCLLCAYINVEAKLEEIFATKEYKDIVQQYENGIVLYNDDNVLFTAESVITGDISLYIQEVINYSITYYVDGEINDTLKPDSYNPTIEVTLPWLEEEGKTFDGWYYNNEYKKPRYSKISINEKNEDIILYGRFLNNIYKAKLNTNGGSLTLEEADVCYLKDYNIPVPEKDGYDFEGWADEDGVLLTDEFGKGLDVWKIPSDANLSAVWSQYVINIDYSGVKKNITKTIARSENRDFTNFFEIPMTSNSDFSIEGWFFNNSCTVDFPKTLDELDKLSGGEKTVTAYTKLSVKSSNKLLILAKEYTRIFLNETNIDIALLINEGSKLSTIYLNNFTSIQEENRPVIDIRGADSSITILCEGDNILVGGNGEDGNESQFDGSNGSPAIITEGLSLDISNISGGIMRLVGGNGGKGYSTGKGGDGGDALNARIRAKIIYNLKSIQNNNNSGLIQFIGGNGGNSVGKGGNGGNGGCGINIKNYTTKDNVNRYEFTLLDILGANSELEIVGGNGGDSVDKVNNYAGYELCGIGGIGGDGIKFISEMPSKMENLQNQYGLYIRSNQVTIKGGNGGKTGENADLLLKLRAGLGGHAIYAKDNDVTIGCNISELYGGDAGENLSFGVDGGIAVECEHLSTNKKCSIYGGRGSAGHTHQCGNGGCPVKLKSINYFKANVDVTLFGGKGGINVDQTLYGNGLPYKFTDENKVNFVDNYVDGDEW